MTDRPNLAEAIAARIAEQGERQPKRTLGAVRPRSITEALQMERADADGPKS